MLDNEQQDGVTEETYLTVVRASSSSSASEQAGNLTVVAMIYWNRRYSDDLQIGYDIAFIKSGHVYRDAGSSGVYKLYGENYVAFGAYMDANPHSPSTLSVSVSKNSKGCKNMLSKGGLSMRRDLMKKITGIVLIAVLIVSFRLVRTLVSMRAPGALLPYLLAHYLLMGAGLALLGVAEQKRPAVEYGVAAGGAILFYLIVGLIQPVQSAQAYAPSPVGGMLIGLCAVQCALQIKRGRVRSDRPLTGALPLLGMMLAHQGHGAERQEFYDPCAGDELAALPVPAAFFEAGRKMGLGAGRAGAAAGGLSGDCVAAGDQPGALRRRT